MRSCRQARRRLLEELDDELHLGAALELELHLAGCASCQQEAARARGVEELLARRGELSVTPLDLERSIARIRERTGSAPGARRGKSWSLRFAAAAALVLALLWASWRSAPSPDPAPPAQQVALLPSTSSSEPGIRAEPPLLLPAELLPPADPARLEQARAEIHKLLRRAAEGVSLVGPRAEAERLALAVEEGARGLRAQGWPLVRLVASALEEDDPRVAAAAARFLGVRPAVSARAALERGLERAELLPAVLAGLVDLGREGQEPLRLALLHPERAGLALDALLAEGGAPAALTLAEALRALPPGAPLEMQRRLLGGLAALGTPSLDPLLALGLERRLRVDEIAWALEPLAGAGQELLRRLEARPASPDFELLLETAARLLPEQALPELEAAAGDRRTRALALGCLASLDLPKACWSLWSLAESGRVPARSLAPALRESLARNADALASELARAAATGDLDRIERGFELAVTCATPEAAPLLLEIARAPLGSDELRLSALLALSEQGGPWLAEPLRALFACFGERERRLAAACLLALHRSAGEAEVKAALSEASERERRQLLAQLSTRGSRPGPTQSLVQISRSLAPVLARRAAPVTAGPSP